MLQTQFKLDKVMGSILYKGLRRQGLYPIPFDLPHSNKDKVATTPVHTAGFSTDTDKSSSDSSIRNTSTQTAFLGRCVQQSLWHQRLRHASNEVLQCMLNKCNTSLMPAPRGGVTKQNSSFYSHFWILKVFEQRPAIILS